MLQQFYCHKVSYLTKSKDIIFLNLISLKVDVYLLKMQHQVKNSKGVYSKQGCVYVYVVDQKMIYKKQFNNHSNYHRYEILK